MSSQWKCQGCTFDNHPALKSCEICELPRAPNTKSRHNRKRKQQESDFTENDFTEFAHKMPKKIVRANNGVPVTVAVHTTLLGSSEEHHEHTSSHDDNTNSKEEEDEEEERIQTKKRKPSKTVEKKDEEEEDSTYKSVLESIDFESKLRALLETVDFTKEGIEFVGQMGTFYYDMQKVFAKPRLTTTPGHKEYTQSEKAVFREYLDRTNKESLSGPVAKRMSWQLYGLKENGMATLRNWKGVVSSYKRYVAIENIGAEEQEEDEGSTEDDGSIKEFIEDDAEDGNKKSIQEWFQCTGDGPNIDEK
eukprot:110515_1